MTQNIVNLWWEDETTLCIETDDGQVWRLEGAEIQSISLGDPLPPEEEDGATIEPVMLVTTPVTFND